MLYDSSVICENTSDVTALSWDSEAVECRTIDDSADFRLSIKTRHTDNQRAGPVRSALKRPEVREAICASERTSDDNGPDRQFVRYIVRHLHTQREKERKRERLPPGTIVESWESSDYIRPINFFAGTDPTVSHSVPEPRGRREEEKEEAAATLLPFCFLRAFV